MKTEIYIALALIIVLVLLVAYQYYKLKATKTAINSCNRRIEQLKQDKRNLSLNNQAYISDLKQLEKRNNNLIDERDKYARLLDKCNKQDCSKRTKPKKIYQLDENGKFIANFDSVKQASIKTNISRSAITRSAKYETTVKGFKFRYKLK